MPIQPSRDYCLPPSKQLRQYAKSLYERRHEGLYILRKPIHLNDWEPMPNHCHANALILENYGTEFEAIHGWFYLDFEQSRDYVRFVAHSVVRDIAGNLIDITPAISSQAPILPFLVAQVSNQTYEAMLNSLVRAYGTTDCLDFKL